MILPSFSPKQGEDFGGTFPKFTDVAALLISRNTDVNVKDSNGKAPLSETGWFGRAEIAALLLDKGAEVNAKDVWGNTPLKRANEFNHPDVSALLKKHGAVK